MDDKSACTTNDRQQGMQSGCATCPVTRLDSHLSPADDGTRLIVIKTS